MKPRIISIFILTAILAAFPLAYAQADDAARKEELKKRFIERNERLVELKLQGIVGETAEGNVEIVDPSTVQNSALKNMQAFLAEENQDRQELYAILARETETTVETVIKQDVARKFKLASLEEYFKAKDGVWRKKKDMLQSSDEKK